MRNTFAVFIVLIFVSGACLDEPDCYLLNNSVVGIAFKKLTEPNADSALTVTALGTSDPPLLFWSAEFSENADTAFSRLNLPLHYFQDEIVYLFQEEDTLRFLRLGYKSQAQFVSEDCGERYVLSDLRVLEHNFDSVRLIVDVPSRQSGTIHLQIFR